MQPYSRCMDHNGEKAVCGTETFWGLNLLMPPGRVTPECFRQGRLASSVGRRVKFAHSEHTSGQCSVPPKSGRGNRKPTSIWRVKTRCLENMQSCVKQNLHVRQGSRNAGGFVVAAGMSRVLEADLSLSAAFCCCLPV